jgi:hypothetical protein
MHHAANPYGSSIVGFSVRKLHLSRSRDHELSYRGKTMKRILLAASLLGLFGMSVPAAQASDMTVPVQNVGWYGYGYRPWGGYYRPWGGYGYYRPYGYYGGWGGGYYRPWGGYGGYYGGGYGPGIGIGVY